jgi:trimeric autotransporter adhesin
VYTVVLAIPTKHEQSTITTVCHRFTTDTTAIHCCAFLFTLSLQSGKGLLPAVWRASELLEGHSPRLVGAVKTLRRSLSPPKSSSTGALRSLFERSLSPARPRRAAITTAATAATTAGASAIVDSSSDYDSPRSAATAISDRNFGTPPSTSSVATTAAAGSVDCRRRSSGHSSMLSSAAYDAGTVAVAAAISAASAGAPEMLEARSRAGDVQVLEAGPDMETELAGGMLDNSYTVDAATSAAAAATTAADTDTNSAATAGEQQQTTTDSSSSSSSSTTTSSIRDSVNTAQTDDVSPATSVQHDSPPQHRRHTASADGRSSSNSTATALVSRGRQSAPVTAAAAAAADGNANNNSSSSSFTAAPEEYAVLYSRVKSRVRKGTLDPYWNQDVELYLEGGEQLILYTKLCAISS